MVKRVDQSYWACIRNTSTYYSQILDIQAQLYKMCIAHLKDVIRFVPSTLAVIYILNHIENTFRGIKNLIGLNIKICFVIKL